MWGCVSVFFHISLRYDTAASCQDSNGIFRECENLLSVTVPMRACRMLGMWMFCVWTRLKPRIGGRFSLLAASSVPVLESELSSRALAVGSAGCATQSDVQVVGRGSCIAVGLPWSCRVVLTDWPSHSPGPRLGDAARWLRCPVRGSAPLGAAGSNSRPSISRESISRTSDRGAGTHRDTAAIQRQPRLFRVPSPQPPRCDIAVERASSPACRDAQGFVSL